MNQLKPANSADRYTDHDTVKTWIPDVDFVIRGIVVFDPAFTLEIYIGGSKDTKDGSLELQAMDQDFCYNFIPLEIPVAEGERIKLWSQYNNHPFSLLTDKTVNLTRE
ncbi:MAG: hypothetical protein PHV74_00140 [Dehalococcoidia bacterium]|nr:hypothetical protein [Dehalococcoidia bacterium]